MQYVAVPTDDHGMAKMLWDRLLVVLSVAAVLATVSLHVVR